jgi:O-antigen/teichoic acid export membrane protein
MSSVPRILASGSGLRMLNFSLQLVVSFFLTPFVVHSLGDRMYGFWTLVGTFIGYYGLLDLGLGSAVSRHVAGAIGAGEKDECNRIFSTTLVLYTGLGIVALILTFVLAGLGQMICKSPEDAALFWKVVLILGFNVAMSFPLRVFNGILTAQVRFDLLAAVDIMSMLLRSALIVFVLTSGYKILALACVTFLSGIPGQVLWILLAKKNLPSLRFSRRDWSPRTAKTLFGYSFFVFISQIANLLRFDLTAPLITAFLGLAQVTHYKIGSLMVGYLISLVVACMGVLHPVFSQLEAAKEHERIKQTLFFSTKISISISSFIGFGLIAWGKPFIGRWMGVEYLDAYPCLVILVLGCFSDLWQTPSIALMFGTSKHRFYAICNLIEGISNLLLSLLLVKHFGLIGFAIGASLPMAVIRLGIQPVYICRVLSIKVSEYAYSMGKTLGIVCLSLACPAIISLKWGQPDYRVLLVIGLASLLLYTIPVWILEFKSTETRILWNSILPGLVGRKTN